MSRYVRRPRAWIEDETYGDAPMIPDITVDGPTDVDTGLVWNDGTAIYRTALPIGFGRDDEW